MQLANPIYRREPVRPKPRTAPPAHIASPEASAEINAYIAIRDTLLAQAEQLATPASITSAAVANDFVAQQVRPARSPYEAQSLSEPDAARERSRCEFVVGRLAQLRMLARSA